MTKPARRTTKATPATKATTKASPVVTALREEFADFFTDPTRDKLRALLKTGGGETAQLDFKGAWPKAGPLTKHILAMANSGGGCLVVGVEETEGKSLEPTGLEGFMDKADVCNSVKLFLPDALFTRIQIEDFDYKASEWAKLTGRKFQVLFVSGDRDHVPHVAVKNGEDLQAGVIYVRREGGSTPASYEEIQRLINQRISGGRSTAVELDLKGHFEQLKVIYDQINKYEGSLLVGAALRGAFSDTMAALVSATANPKYPKENFEDFILKLIEKKKRRIAHEVDVTLDD